MNGSILDPQSGCYRGQSYGSRCHARCVDNLFTPTISLVVAIDSPPVMPQHQKICTAGLSGANPAPRGVHRSPERGFHPGGQPGGLGAKVDTLLSVRLGVRCCHAGWKHVTPIRKEAFQQLSGVGNLARLCQSGIGLYGRSSPRHPHASRWRTSWIGGRRHAGMAQIQFLPSPLRRPQRNECAAVKVVP